MIILIIGSTSDSGHSSSSPRYCIKKNCKVLYSLASCKTSLIRDGDLIFIIGENKTERFTGHFYAFLFIVLVICVLRIIEKTWRRSIESILHKLT